MEERIKKLRPLQEIKYINKKKAMDWIKYLQKTYLLKDLSKICKKFLKLNNKKTV
jgi:hypothetical protein